MNLTSKEAAYFSILFDLGGIVGGIIAGQVADATGKNASTCAVMLILSIPLVLRTIENVDPSIMCN
jgi:OPA family glycerol-3-phosphate transporter-like MFS transporter 1/2